MATAHRGSRLLWPENTMVAFQGAVDLGFRSLETDLHATRDGVLVCIHDATLDRTTGSKGPVSKLTFDELGQVDAGFRHAPMEHFPHRGTGVTVPSLEELVKSFPDARFTVDMKQSDIDELLTDAIDRYGLWDRVLVGSFHGSALRRLRRRTEGRVATATGYGETLRHWFSSRFGKAAPQVADALFVPVRAYGMSLADRKSIAAAHEIGLRVHVWTVDDEAEMNELLDLGVDGLITDRPDVLKEVMISRGAGGPWN